MDVAVLPDRLRRALEQPSAALDELPLREAFATLLDVYALHLGPIDEMGDAVQWQHDPRTARIKARLELRLRARLDTDWQATPLADAVTTMRRIAREELVPPLYDWLAVSADRDQLAEFIAVEGGPDADFDDLVAIGQIGLSGLAKLTLAANYWDEMGRGRDDAVHTELHRRMVDALPVRPTTIEDLPLEAIERRVLNGYLATNRGLQPELLGNLGLIECQAGPRCRRVVAALRRLGAPDDALPFYDEHSVADPRHGKDWIENAIAPLVLHSPHWGPRIVRGAEWRAGVNRRFFTAMKAHLGVHGRRAA